MDSSVFFDYIKSFLKLQIVFILAYIYNKILRKHFFVTLRHTSFRKNFLGLIFVNDFDYVPFINYLNYLLLFIKDKIINYGIN